MSGAKRSRPVAAAAVVLLAASALTACTGVPSSSAPEVVTAVDAGQPSELQISSPPPGADPRTIVQTFLSASALADTRSQVAQAFLTRDMFQRWNGSTATVVSNIQFGNFDKGTIQVSGQKVGTIDTTGVYTPNLDGTGNGVASQPVSASIGVRDVPGQGWRIDNIQNGLLIDSGDFERVFTQRSLYFFDSTEQRLVADPRWTSYNDPALLAKWLGTQLAGGPRQELANATNPELPTQASTAPAQVTVTLGTPAQVQIPGAAQLQAETRARLAAEVANTMLPVTSGDIEIVDGGHPVSIPGVGTRFTASEFSTASAPANPSPSVYYLVNGRVVDFDGKAIGAPTTYVLKSFAIARAGSSDLRLAGTVGSGADAQLVVGTFANGLRETGLRGELSRPAWAPRLSEVWVGRNTSLYRVGLRGNATAVQLSAANGPVRGQVAAVRFSPDGARVALVLKTDDGSQIWIGSVTRNPQSAQVAVEGLEPISPQGISITDVAWNDQVNLFAIGREAGVGSVYEVHVDGSLWRARGTSNLPQAPDSITVAEREVAWVSAGGTVWEQAAGSWVSPGQGETPGENPVYLE
jgi:hypothetical protein